MTSTTASTNRSTIIWIVVGVVAVIGLFVVALTSGGRGGAGLGGSYTVEAFGEVTVEGTLTPTDPSSVGVVANDPEVGQPAPVVTGTNWDGEPTSISADGTPRVIVFLAHWCPHCQNEVPRLVSALDGGTTIGGAELVGVATSTNITRGNYPPAAWLSNAGWSAPIIMDDQDMSVLRAYGISSFPGWAVVSGDGNIVARATGELSMDQVEALAALAVAG